MINCIFISNCINLARCLLFTPFYVPLTFKCAMFNKYDNYFFLALQQTGRNPPKRLLQKFWTDDTGEYI